MKFVISPLLAVLVLASFAWSQSVTPKKGSGQKTNLDLPFDAEGAENEEEEAPDSAPAICWGGAGGESGALGFQAGMFGTLKKACCCCCRVAASPRCSTPQPHRNGVPCAVRWESFGSAGMKRPQRQRFFARAARTLGGVWPCSGSGSPIRLVRREVHAPKETPCPRRPPPTIS